MPSLRSMSRPLSAANSPFSRSGPAARRWPARCPPARGRGTTPPCRPFSCLRLPPQNRPCPTGAGANRQNTRTLFFGRPRARFRCGARASSLTHHPYLQTCRSRRTWPCARGACRALVGVARLAARPSPVPELAPRPAAALPAPPAVTPSPLVRPLPPPWPGRAAAAAVSPRVGCQICHWRAHELYAVVIIQRKVDGRGHSYLKISRAAVPAGSRGRSARWLVSYIPLGRSIKST